MMHYGTFADRQCLSMALQYYSYKIYPYNDTYLRGTAVGYNGTMGWMHFAVTYDGTTLTAYQHGSATLSYELALNMTNANGYIGYAYYTSGGAVSGYGELADARVYATCLTPDQIMAIASFRG